MEEIKVSVSGVETEVLSDAVAKIYKEIRNQTGEGTMMQDVALQRKFDELKKVIKKIQAPKQNNCVNLQEADLMQKSNPSEIKMKCLDRKIVEVRLNIYLSYPYLYKLINEYDFLDVIEFLCIHGILKGNLTLQAMRSLKEN